MAVAVVSASGKPLMPTSSYRARKLLKGRRAEIYRRDPFTIRLLYREDGETQPVEMKVDTGYQHIGISVCSEKHEFVHEERELLDNEVKMHDDRRKYRRNRRNRLRHRAPRFDNRRKPEGWLAPSLRNRRDMHLHLFRRYTEVFPVTDAWFEMGQFDTQVLKAQEEGRPLPEGTDYQHGERYGFDTLREAVFSRDGYRCVFCGRGMEEHAILHVHHLGYWKGDHTDRMGNLAAACERCHTPMNHQKGGLLYGREPELKTFKGATFMTAVRWQMLAMAREIAPGVNIHATYGAQTKESRRELGIPKTHANDAYAMGNFHPRHKAREVMYKKLRRCSRVLEKFYDAKYVDLRDGTVKAGKELGSGRINRREPRVSAKSLRKYRGHKVSKGRRTVRRQRYAIRPGTVFLLDGKRHASQGVHNHGKDATYKNSSGKTVSVSVKKITVVRHPNGWKLIITSRNLNE